MLEESGWNFRHAYYHELGRRTLLKAYGVKFIVQVQILEDTEVSENISFSVEVLDGRKLALRSIPVWVLNRKNIYNRKGK